MDLVGFRIKADLSDFFDDERSWSYIFVDFRKQRLIAHLAEHIKHVFMINEPVVLFCDKLLVPFSESVNVLKEGDKVRVAKAKNGFSSLNNYKLQQPESEDNVCISVAKKTKKKQKQVIVDISEPQEMSTTVKRTSETTNGLSELDNHITEPTKQETISTSFSKRPKRKQKQVITDIPYSSKTKRTSETTNGLSELDYHMIHPDNQESVNPSFSKNPKRKYKPDIIDVPDSSECSSTSSKRWNSEPANGDLQCNEIKNHKKKNKNKIVNSEFIVKKNLTSINFENSNSDIEVQHILVNTFHEKHTQNTNNLLEFASEKSDSFKNNSSDFTKNCSSSREELTEKLDIVSKEINETCVSQNSSLPIVSVEEELGDEEEPTKHKRRRRHRARKKKKPTVKNILLNNPDSVEVNISDTLQQKNLVNIFLKNKHVRFNDELQQENSHVDKMYEGSNNVVTTVAQIHAENIEENFNKKHMTCELSEELSEQLPIVRVSTNDSFSSSILSHLQSLEKETENEEDNVSETLLTSTASSINISSVLTNGTESPEKDISGDMECQEQVPEQRNIDKTDAVSKSQNSNTVQHEKIYSEADLEKYPVLVGTPKRGDLILFKVLKITENCTPELSQYIFSRVNNFYMTSQEMDITVLEGHKELEPSVHRLSWNTNDGDKEAEESSLVMNWNEIYEPRLVFAFNSNLPNSLESRNIT